MTALRRRLTLPATDAIAAPGPTKRRRRLSRWATMAIGIALAAQAPLAGPSPAQVGDVEGEWHETGDMAVARRKHGSVVLDPAACRSPEPPPGYPCGKVLVVGGETPSSALTRTASVELYHPGATDPQTNATGTWTSCPPTADPDGDPTTPAPEPSAQCPAPMEFARSNHAVTLLGDGKVLVVGGDCTVMPVVPSHCPLSAEVYDPITGRWRRTGSPAMNTPLAVLLDAPACAQASPPGWCGHVLAFDGITSKLYDPEAPDPDTGQKGTWRPIGGQQSSQGSGPVPVALGDGRVLAVGGFSQASTKAEVFDPASEGWAPTGAPVIPRTNHNATLLTSPRCASAAPPQWCGTVLVAGGQRFLPGGNPAGREEAEVYFPNETDPATGRRGTFRATTAMGSGRKSFQVANIGDGRVLVAGGEDDANEVTASAKIYDPAASPPTWTTVAAMSSPRLNYALVALGGAGRVLAAGGRVSASGATLASAEVFEAPPASDLAAPSAAPVSLSPGAGPTQGGTRVVIEGQNMSMAVAVAFGGQPGRGLRVLDDRRVVVTTPLHAEAAVPVVVRSLNGSSTAVPGRFEYRDLASVTAGGFTGISRFHHRATVLGDGRVLISGGRTFEDVMDAEDVRRRDTAYFITSSEIYDPSVADPVSGLPGDWSHAGNMATPRWFHTATLLPDGRVLATGGSAHPSNLAQLASAEIFDPTLPGDPTTGARGAWVPAAPMAVPRVGHTATLLGDGKVLVVGGDAAGTAEIYDPRLGAWAPTPSQPLVSRPFHTATLLDGPACSAPARPAWCHQVLVAGGGESLLLAGVASAQLYNPATGVWASAGALEQQRRHHTATLLASGQVLIAGGYDFGSGHLSAAEVYDPAGGSGTGAWRATGSMSFRRSWHTATSLANGKVLVAGGDGGHPLATTRPEQSEIYDPAAQGGTGAFVEGPPLLVARQYHSAVVLPAGPASACATLCGRVLLVGGETFGPAILNSTELIAPLPEVTSVSPAVGPRTGGTAVSISGSGLAGAVAVRFGDVAVEAVPDPVSPATRLTAVAPRQSSPGEVEVSVVVRTDPDTLLTSRPSPAARFRYLSGVPGLIDDLQAKPGGEDRIELAFSAPRAPGSGEVDPPPALEYQVRQSTSPIVDLAGFDAATPLCGGRCSFDPPPASEGDRIALSVLDLDPGTTYHFAVRAIGAGGEVGPLSNPASATTLGTPPVPEPPGCPALPAPVAGQARYNAGYSLVGVPGGTVLNSDSPLYGWANQGAGANYTTLPAAQPAAAGHAYWAWFACPRAVDLGAGTSSVRLPLDAYHASMVGNPSATSRATVSGHDFAAAWDRTLNDGAGGYRISAYREAQSLPVGRGTWVFSYVPTTVEIKASG